MAYNHGNDGVNADGTLNDKGLVHNAARIGTVNSSKTPQELFNNISSVLSKNDPSFTPEKVAGIIKSDPGLAEAIIENMNRNRGGKEPSPLTLESITSPAPQAQAYVINTPPGKVNVFRPHEKELVEKAHELGKDDLSVKDFLKKMSDEVGSFPKFTKAMDGRPGSPTVLGLEEAMADAFVQGQIDSGKFKQEDKARLVDVFKQDLQAEIKVWKERDIMRPRALDAHAPEMFAAAPGKAEPAQPYLRQQGIQGVMAELGRQTQEMLAQEGAAAAEVNGLAARYPAPEVKIDPNYIGIRNGELQTTIEVGGKKITHSGAIGGGHFTNEKGETVPNPYLAHLKPVQPAAPTVEPVYTNRSDGMPKPAATSIPEYKENVNGVAANVIVVGNSMYTEQAAQPQYTNRSDGMTKPQAPAAEPAPAANAEAAPKGNFDQSTYQRAMAHLQKEGLAGGAVALGELATPSTPKVADAGRGKGGGAGLG